MGRNQGWCFFMAAAMVAALLPVPTMTGCLDLKNEISGVTALLRVWNNGPSVVIVFSVQSGFRNCGDGGDKCIWVAKRDGFYQRRIAWDENERKHFVDILKTKWVWKW
ncbi:unnamed protein product [Eruca vesicaria subsp. sativa]|uniref:S-protein homolog n=1 Tax=Eruca vesicaria subsp. sativa TaxID=29727 RepID=A0ABC8IV57_ERUVS|nr:unnamed protein product [Eruca vesicaria subsp. sativa]